MDDFEKKLKEATLDPVVAIQVASDIATKYLGNAHKRLDGLRVEIARMKLALKEKDPKMKMNEIEMRIEATETFLEFLTAGHDVERLEQFIMIAKAHSRVSGQY